MRKGKISVENLSGGEVTSAPLLATPKKYSRLLQNFYINSEGHIAKVPGWSAISQQISDVTILTGIDFKKSNGESIILVGGRANSGMGSVSSVHTAATGLPSTVFTGAGVNDIAYGGAYTGSAAALFEIEVYQQGTGLVGEEWSGDVYRWRKNGGAWSFIFGDISQPQTFILSDGITAISQTGYGHTVGNKWSLDIKADLDDMVPSGTYTETGAGVFDIEIDTQGTPDKFKWRKDGGAYTTGVSITGSAQLLSHGISVTFTATTGHAKTSKWTVTATTYSGVLYRKYGSVLSPIKQDFVSLNPLYMAQSGDIVIASNGVDRPVAYNGTSFQNINLPFGNSTVFSGTGLNDFTASITFTYESAVYEVEIDGVAVVPAPTFSGAGVNDLSVPSPDFSGDTNTSNYDVEIDGTGAGDTIKYNVNGGPYVTGQALTTAGTGLDIGSVRIKASATVGHDSRDIYEFQVTSNGTPDKFKWRKNSGAWSAEISCTAYPTYAALDSDYSISFESATGNTTGDVYAFQVDGATTPDTFKWRRDSDAYTETVNIVAGAISLGNGISIQFNYFTGHTLTNSWTFDVSRDTVKYSKDGSSVATEQPITGEYQTIQAGVQFKFGAINGHTLADKWTMPVDQSVRFTKLYQYKNRVWAIGSDGLTAYHSDLYLPTDFTGTGAGYFDFSYIVPKGDILTDMSSLMNYLVFFFNNHIVVYSGSDPTSSGDFTIYQNIDGVGIVAPNTVVSVGSDIYFLTTKGVKGLKQLINAGALNIDNVSAPIDKDIIDAIEANTSGVYSSAHYPTLGLVMFLVGTTMFIYNYRQNSWSRIVIPSANDVSKILSMFETHDGRVYMGGYDYLFEFDPDTSTYNFNGQAPTYRWTGPMWSATTAESMFFTEMILRLASTKAASLTVKVRAIGYDTQVEDQSAFNEQVITISAITTLDAVFNFVNVPLFGAGKYVQIDITETPNPASNDDLEFAAVEIQGEIGIP